MDYNCRTSIGGHVDFSSQHHRNRISQPSNLHFFLPNWLASRAIAHSRLLHISTERITSEVEFGDMKHLRNAAVRHFIYSGDLSEYLVPIAETSTAREIAQIFDVGFDFRATESYASYLHNIESGGRSGLPDRPMSKRRDVDEYFEYLVRLIRSIATHGCVRHRDQALSDVSLVSQNLQRLPHQQEIGCAVGPSGEIWLFNTGHHRLHIASQLGIPQIHATLYFVHWQWILDCFSKYGGDPISAIVDGLRHFR